MSEDKFKIDPNLINSIQQSKTKNVGHSISKLFDDLGNVAEYKEQKRVEAEDKQSKKELERINLEAIKQQTADKANFMKFVKMDSSIEDSGIEFNTPEYYTLAKDFSNKKKTLLEEDAINYNMAQATKLFMDEKGNFNEKAFYSHMDKKLLDKKIDEKIYAGVIDGINKARKGGIYSEKKESKDIYTTDYKNYILENTQLHGENKKSWPLFSEWKNQKSYAPSIEKKNYEDEMTSQFGEDKTSWTPYHEWLPNYRQSKKLSGENTYNQVIDVVVKDYSEKLKTDDFSKVDFNKAIEDKLITPNEKRYLERKLASTREAKNLETTFSKYKQEYAVIDGQAQRFAKYANSKAVNTDVIQNATDIVKTYIPDFNMSKEEVENFEFRSDFLNLSSVILKLQSGLTVTDKEREQFNRSMGTLLKNKKVNFIGIKQKILDRKNALESIKDTAPEYFNVKYGHRLRSIESSLDVIDGYLQNDNDNKEKNTNEVTILKDKTSKVETQENTDEKPKIKFHFE